LNALVIIPDCFRGEPILLSFFPPDTEEKKQILQRFVKEKADAAANTEVLLKVAEESRRRWSGVEGWGVFGLCWGGKV
jgi:dienelactone hydrolase